MVVGGCSGNGLVSGIFDISEIFVEFYPSNCIAAPCGLASAPSDRARYCGEAWPAAQTGISIVKMLPSPGVLATSTRP